MCGGYTEKWLILHILIYNTAKLNSKVNVINNESFGKYGNSALSNTDVPRGYATVLIKRCSRQYAVFSFTKRKSVCQSASLAFGKYLGQLSSYCFLMSVCKSSVLPLVIKCLIAQKEQRVVSCLSCDGVHL